MDEITRRSIRHIFLSQNPTFALLPAAKLLGIPFEALKREISDGSIVAVSTRLGQRIPREEMIAAAMRTWELAVIEAALGDQAAAVLPEAIRLVELRARVPRYQKEMLRYLARQEGTSIGTILSRELEGMASALSINLLDRPPCCWASCLSCASMSSLDSRRARSCKMPRTVKKGVQLVLGWEIGLV